MRRRFLVLTALAAAVLGLLYLTGCGNKVTVPEKPPIQDPETELTYAPLPGDTTTFRVHFYWNGYDKDGEVMTFHFAVDDDTLKPIPDWPTTNSKDTTLLFLVDPVKGVRQHVFKVSSQDNDGKWDTTPAFRFFSAKTLPPTSLIKRGPAAFNPIIGPNFTFEWEGIDPDGGETGGRTPVDSFEYVLLLIGATGAPGAAVLPRYEQDFYVKLINESPGHTLTSNFSLDGHDYSDWNWIGIRALKNRFRNATPGEYVFAERAVDLAGATEKNLAFGNNIRHFTVTTKNPGLTLTVTSSVLTLPLDPPATGPTDIPRKPLQIFEGETISFSWSANGDAYGGEVVGYTYALDDTSSFPGLDLLRTGATFKPSQLPPGPHFLFVRAIDDGGLITNAVIPMKIVHPTFKDPGAPRSILYVDDSTPPGVTQDRTISIGSFPRDIDEDHFWHDGDPGILIGLAPLTWWDTSKEGYGETEGRKPPEPENLSTFTTVVWNVDFNNGVGNPTGLWRTLVGGAYSELSGYLRAGGTMILSGFLLGGNVINPNTALYGNTSRGICFTLVPGTKEYALATFPRMFMGVDGAVLGGPDLRTAGGKDFIQARPTAVGRAMGLDTADVDRGPLGSGAKWITYFGTGDFNSNKTPGLVYVDGFIMARNFACVDAPSSVFKLEDPNRPIAEPIYTYHGVRTGVNEDGGASPREGLVVGIRTQAHDLGTDPEGSRVITRGNAAGAIGRIVHLAFPLYFIKNEQAAHLIQACYQYVDQSPTLP